MCNPHLPLYFVDKYLRYLPNIIRTSRLGFHNFSILTGVT